MADGIFSGTVNIPHVGKLPKAAVLAGVGVTIFLIIRHYQHGAPSTAAAAGAGAAAGDPYPSDGTYGNPDDPYSLDPTTGVTYGDEAAAGLGAGYGGYDVGLPGGGGGGGYGISAATDTYPWDGTYSNSSDPYSMNPATGQTYGNSGTVGTSPGVTTGAGGPPFSTNSQWSQYVLQYFTTSGFSDLPGLQSAIGAYLNGQSVTTLQQGYINEATAIAGTPPVTGPGGYPPSIRVTGSTSGGGSSSASTGSGSSSGAQVSTVSGGHIVPGTLLPTRATVAWDASGPATEWQVTITGPGPLNGRTNTVPVKEAVYSGLESGHNYEVRVQPILNGKPNGTAGTIDIKTP